MHIVPCSYLNCYFVLFFQKLVSPISHILASHTLFIVCNAICSPCYSANFDYRCELFPKHALTTTSEFWARLLSRVFYRNNNVVLHSFFFPPPIGFLWRINLRFPTGNFVLSWSLVNQGWQNLGNCSPLLWPWQTLLINHNTLPAVPWRVWEPSRS